MVPTHLYESRPKWFWLINNEAGSFKNQNHRRSHAYEPAVDLWSNTNAMEIPFTHSPLLVPMGIPVRASVSFRYVNIFYIKMTGFEMNRPMIMAL